MNQEVNIYTETMAKVYTDQGHWAKAAEIYHHLVAREPRRQDFADALAEAKKKMNEAPRKNPEELVPLFREWIELLLRHEKLQKLMKLKNRLQGNSDIITTISSIGPGEVQPTRGENSEAMENSKFE